MARKVYREPSWIVKELLRVCSDSKVTTTHLMKVFHEKGLARDRSTLRNWFTGRSSPRIEDVEIMAECLGYELDLLQNPDAPKTLQQKVERNRGRKAKTILPVFMQPTLESLQVYGVDHAPKVSSSPAL